MDRTELTPAFRELGACDKNQISHPVKSRSQADLGSKIMALSAGH